MPIIAFFEGIRSERQLTETVSLNLAHRWFIGYHLDENVPDHSSLSKIREHYGMPILQQFFGQIVGLCVEAGLVWGEELYVDSTIVDANASIDSMIDRAEAEVDQHLTEYYLSDQFEYDAENDQYICPQNHVVPFMDAAQERRDLRLSSRCSSV